MFSHLLRVAIGLSCGAPRTPTRSACRAVQSRHVDTRVLLCRVYFAYGPGTGCVSGGLVPGWLAVESRPPPLINVRTTQKHKCSHNLIWVITLYPLFESENRRAGFETDEYDFPTVEQIITANATQRSCRSTEERVNRRTSYSTARMISS